MTVPPDCMCTGRPHPGRPCQDRRYAVASYTSPEHVAGLRRTVAAHLRHWRLDLHAEPVARGVAELLSRAHRHSGPDNRCVVELRWSGRHLTASVEDGDPRLPRLRTAGDSGLARVAALSDSWGTCATADGKVIWFTRSVRAPQNVFRVVPPPLVPLDTALLDPVPLTPVPLMPVPLT
ncbi:ATP-binding protein [Streptomyces sp. NPDC127033]|uniref:ATP-binding protein n=1 Tax=Streptomyces sp. NPDC127033 TaxID=3347110 RepID=UPI0036536F0B